MAKEYYSRVDHETKATSLGKLHHTKTKIRWKKSNLALILLEIRIENISEWF